MSELEQSVVASQVSQILNPTLQDQDFLQSFVRIELEEKSSATSRIEKRPNEEEKSSSGRARGKVDTLNVFWGDSGTGLESRRSSRSQSRNERKFRSLQEEMSAQRSRRKRRRRSEIALRQEEVYTDKDRAAAVNMGTRDIKQSLKIKRKQDRSRTLQIPEEADPSAILALAQREMRSSGDVGVAIQCINKVVKSINGGKSERFFGTFKVVLP